MKKPLSHSINQRCLPYLLSALLLGLSYPSYPYIRLEALAWIWMLPMLLALKSVESFPKFLRNVYLTLLCVAVIGMSWLALSTFLGALLLFAIFPIILSVPLVIFYFVRQSFGWRVALLSLPPVWTACDWLYQGTEGSLGWLPIGVTQSNLYWLVQYIDVTGMWGITFWLVLFNVLIVMAIDDWREQFSVSGFQFSAVASRLKIALIRKLAIVAALMLVFPMAYSAYVFIEAARASSGNDRELSVVLRKTVALTNRALAKSETKPDLIIMPETAVPYDLTEDKEARETIYRGVARWQTPLLTGLLDAPVADDAAAS